MSKSPSSLLLFALVALCCLIWGSTWQVIRGGLQEHLPPLTSAAARFVIAGAVMAALAPFLHRREGGTPPPLRVWLPYGLLNVTGSFAIVYTSETEVPGGLASVLWTSFPLEMALFGRLWLGERLRPLQLLGIAVSCVGIVLLFWLHIAGLGRQVLAMSLFLLLSPLVSAFGTVVLKKHGGGCSSALVNRNAMLLGAVTLSLLAFLREQPLQVAWSPKGLLSVGYLAVVGTVVSFSAYNYCLRWVPANRMSLIAFVTPLISVGLDWSLGLADVTASQAAGCAVTLAGIVLVVRKPKPR